MNRCCRIRAPSSFKAAAVLAYATWAALASSLALLPAPSQAQDARLLYFTRSAGYRHEVIPASQAVLNEIGACNAFTVTMSEDVEVFTPENLRGYRAVMFFTTGELPLSEAERAALLDFVRSGGGFVGVHSATDTFYEWPDYGKLIGGYFNEHPWHQKVTIAVAEPGNPLVGFLAPSFKISDEIYQIRDFEAATSQVLLRLDPSSVDLKAPNVRPRPYGWPLAWTRAFGQGRVFYTALGHEEAVWRDPRYQQMLTNAIMWVMGGVR
jgi:uncharacterized protein